MHPNGRVADVGYDTGSDGFEARRRDGRSREKEEEEGKEGEKPVWSDCVY